MKAVVQRVTEASVKVGGDTIGQIGEGLLVLLGVAAADTAEDANYLLDKILNLRIFEDEDSRMNLSLIDRGLELLVVSQFTLLGDTRRGRRPSFIGAAPPEKASELYELFVSEARGRIDKVATGRFRAMMDVALVNSGPVTIILDSTERT